MDQLQNFRNPQPFGAPNRDTDGNRGVGQSMDSQVKQSIFNPPLGHTFFLQNQDVFRVSLPEYSESLGDSVGFCQKSLFFLMWSQQVPLLMDFHGILVLRRENQRNVLLEIRLIFFGRGFWNLWTSKTKTTRWIALNFFLGKPHTLRITPKKIQPEKRSGDVW